MALFDLGPDKKAPKFLQDPVNNALRKGLYGPHYDGSPSAKEQLAMDAAKAGPDPAPDLPTDTTPSVLDAVSADDKLAKKRKGRASTLLTGDMTAPTTTQNTLLGSF